MDAPSRSSMPPSKVSRRLFLKRTAWGVVWLGVSKHLLATSPLSGAARAIPTTTNTAGRLLSSSQMATLQSLCDRLLPSDGALPAASSLNVAGKLDQFLTTIDPPVAAQIAQLLDLFEFSPMIFDFKWGRFSSLSPGEQDEILNSWATSRLEFRRTGFVALKKLSMAVYYSQEAAWKAIGYDGPLV
ncbi:MAG: gluconate 2-dehydrogenase subunit 3 family protein [Acidobacteriia bacterium]|nr:gluconate 2-dehydrogenase subunit 3 family protein [Terriglobia bacterium]